MSRIISLSQAFKTDPLCGIAIRKTESTGVNSFHAIGIDTCLVDGDVVTNMHTLPDSVMRFLHCRENISGGVLNFIGRQQSSCNAYYRDEYERKRYNQRLALLDRIPVFDTEEDMLLNYYLYITPELMKFVVGHDPILMKISISLLALFSQKISRLNDYEGTYKGYALLLGISERELQETLQSQFNRLLLDILNISVTLLDRRNLRIELRGDTRDMRRSGYVAPIGVPVQKAGAINVECFTHDAIDLRSAQCNERAGLR